MLTWKGAHLLPDCLRALLADAARTPADVRVVVVDNASADGTTALLARDFPEVEHLRLPGNLGYARANNEALRRALAAGAEFAALLNDDVEVEPGWLGALLAAAGAQPRAGLLCGTLLFRDAEQVNSTGLQIDSLGRARDRDFEVPRAALARPDGPAQGASGGALLLRAQALREVGLFDPAYFAYYEDVDLSLRAARAGWLAWYVAAATARHRFGASFGRGSPAQRRLLGRNHLRTLALHQPAGRALLLVPAVAALRLGVKAPLELAGGRAALALAEARAGLEGFAEALRAVPVRLRGGIPRGAEPGAQK